MQLALSEEESAFREEMRTFFTTKIPQEIRDTVAAGRHLGKDGIVTAQRILNEAGLAVPNWPVEWGGQDWTPLQRHIWHEEMQLAVRAAAAGVQRQHGRSGDRELRFARSRSRSSCRRRPTSTSGGARASPSPTPAPTWPR